MDFFKISQTKTGVHIEGFPDAAKVILLDGPKAKRLADLALHSSDLRFARSCLDVLAITPEAKTIEREALWRASIAYFFKCFGDSKARFKLHAANVYKKEPPEAFVVFKYFENLRNRHFLHDENSYAQSTPAAILNNSAASNKIAKIICLNLFTDTINQDHFSNFSLLVDGALVWVTAQFDELCSKFTQQLESEPYETLFNRKAASARVASVSEVGLTRLMDWEIP